MNNKYYLTRKRKYEMEYKVLNKKKHTKLHNKFSFYGLHFILVVLFIMKIRFLPGNSIANVITSYVILANAINFNPLKLYAKIISG